MSSPEVKPNADGSDACVRCAKWRGSKTKGLCQGCARVEWRQRRRASGFTREVTVSEKTCKACGQNKPAADFFRDVCRGDGLAPDCKVCRTALRHARGYNLRKYGVTVEAYAEMVAVQNGVCAICKGPPTYRGRLFVDHCHDTGAIRGLLCAQCNNGIGLLGDDSDVLRSAAAYLERSRRPVSNRETQ